MIIYILLAIILGLVVFFAIASRQPDEFSISRTGLITAPTSLIFPHVNNLHKWDAWSPWAKLDPNAKNTFEGPDEGTGAKMSWAGNNKVGVGSMTILESVPNDLIRFQLDFQKPMRASNIAEFTFSPEENQTRVTWTMTGTNNLIGKAMGLLVNCEKMVGGQFEQGLTALKAVVEGRPA